MASKNLPPIKTPEMSKEEQASLGTVVLRTEFYRDGYRILMRVFFFETIVLLLMVVLGVGIVNTYKPENRYFATTEDGRVVPMISLSEPNMSHSAILSWVAQTTTETMTFGFNDYRQRLQSASQYFTRSGWVSFVAALDQAGTMNALATERQIISSVPAQAPVILSEGVKDGVYQWVIELPMDVKATKGQDSSGVRQNVRLLIVRVPRLENKNGVAIQQWSIVKDPTGK